MSPSRRTTARTFLPIISTSARGGEVAADLTSAVAGILVSWSVDSHGHVFPDHRDTADDDYPHVVVDRDGIEWTVREMATPQVWARAPRCLVLSSRECVRRIWHYPDDWRSLDADELLRLGRAD